MLLATIQKPSHKTLMAPNSWFIMESGASLLCGVLSCSIAWRQTLKKLTAFSGFFLVCGSLEVGFPSYLIKLDLAPGKQTSNFRKPPFDNKRTKEKSIEIHGKRPEKPWCAFTAPSKSLGSRSRCTRRALATGPCASAASSETRSTEACNRDPPDRSSPKDQRVKSSSKEHEMTNMVGFRWMIFWAISQNDRVEWLACSAIRSRPRRAGCLSFFSVVLAFCRKLGHHEPLANTNLKDSIWLETLLPFPPLTPHCCQIEGAPKMKAFTKEESRKFLKDCCGAQRMLPNCEDSVSKIEHLFVIHLFLYCE